MFVKHFCFFVLKGMHSPYRISIFEFKSMKFFDIYLRTNLLRSTIKNTVAFLIRINLTPRLIRIIKNSFL